MFRWEFVVYPVPLQCTQQEFVVFQQEVGVYTPYHCGVPVGIQGVWGVAMG